MVKKSFVSLLAVLMVFTGLGSSTFASTIHPDATQPPGDQAVHLGTYNLGSASSWHSNYCTPTKSTMTLRVHNTGSGSVTVTVQRRDGSKWVNVGSGYYVPGGQTHDRFFGTRDADYRLRVATPIFGSASGYVSCI